MEYGLYRREIRPALCEPFTLLFFRFVLARMLLPAVAALFGITAGTLYQKRYCTQHDLLAVTVHQYLPTVALFWVCALLLETREIDWTVQFVAALLWLVLALSIGAILLLTYLIKHGEASKVSSLF